MKGFPKWINTKQDIDNLLADAAYKTQAEDYCRDLIRALQIPTWTDNGEGVPPTLDGYVLDMNARLFKLGFDKTSILAVVPDMAVTYAKIEAGEVI
jgi:hypothetical protein